MVISGQALSTPQRTPGRTEGLENPDSDWYFLCEQDVLVVVNNPETGEDDAAQQM